VRRPISLKPDTYPESMDVDVTDISVKVSAHYPGRSAIPLKASAVERRRDGFAEVSRGHSKRRPRREGPNVSEVIHVLSFDGAGDAELKAAKLEPMTEGRRRNLR
jgi:hypothetical protein